MHYGTQYGMHHVMHHGVHHAMLCLQVLDEVGILDLPSLTWSTHRAAPLMRMHHSAGYACGRRPLRSAVECAVECTMRCTMRCTLYGATECTV